MSDVRLSLSQLAGRFQAAGGSVEQVVASALKECEPLAVRGVVKMIREGVGPNGEVYPRLAHDRPRGPGKPLQNTGLYAASFTARADGLTLTVGTNAVQGPLLNFGGTVLPVNGKYLSIPATVEAERAESPRRYPGKLSPRVGKKGGVLVDGAGKVQFYLSLKVVVPPRPHVGFSAETQADILAVVGDRLAAKLGGL